VLLKLLDYFFKLCHLLWNTFFNIHFYDCHREVICEPFPVLQVALLATGPYSTVTMLFPHPTSLVGQDFPILSYFVVLEVCSVLVSKPGWLAMCLLELVEGELQLYWSSCVIGWDHCLFLLFQL
jgi:hypothetical protein